MAYKHIRKLECIICCSTIKLERHHVYPRGLFNSDEVVTLCKKHHVRVHNILNEMRVRLGYINMGHCISAIEQLTKEYKAA